MLLHCTPPINTDSRGCNLPENVDYDERAGQDPFNNFSMMNDDFDSASSFCDDY